MENSLMKSPMKDEDNPPSFQEFNWEVTTDDDTTDSPMKDEDDRKIIEYQWPSTNSVNIWANEISQKRISDHANMRKSVNYEHGSSSTYHPINPSNLGQNLSNKMLSNSCIGAQGSAHYNRPPLDHSNWSREDYSVCLSYLSNQSVVKMARNPKDSRLLQKILELNNSDHIQRILDEVLSSFNEVMIYESGHALFVKLVEFCNDQQLHLILSTFQFHMDLFLQTAFTKNGSMSIQVLIVSLKEKPSLAKMCSKIVSLKLFALMTHRVGRHIVEKCFCVLNEKQNEVLYRGVISCFRDLATNVNGCISLNVSIDHITNPLRKELLERIVNHSAYFAHHPSGNYVVQHILTLGDIQISNKVCSQLEKEYIQLAFKRTGNRVVGKCLDSSNAGTISVVAALLKDEKAIVRLAKHFYGNYVIQKALQYTKMHGQEARHQDLVRVLMAHSSELVDTKPGKHVISTINYLVT